jgi:hypothetical protein
VVGGYCKRLEEGRRMKRRFTDSVPPRASSAFVQLGDVDAVPVASEMFEVCERDQHEREGWKTMGSKGKKSEGKGKKKEGDVGRAE